MVPNEMCNIDTLRNQSGHEMTMAKVSKGGFVGQNIFMASTVIMGGIEWRPPVRNSRYHKQNSFVPRVSPNMQIWALFCVLCVQLDFIYIQRRISEIPETVLKLMDLYTNRIGLEANKFRKTQAIWAVDEIKPGEN